ncbi:MAG: HNH endonuclease [Kiritimatiellae bacterium]|nr:HNH endonuclease [Kiritimatiellia bacterium]
MRWRWDQGRLQYFHYNNIVRIASILTKLDGVLLNVKGDPLREFLTIGTGLPFAPTTYTVWRNYARVFQCAMLATKVNGKLAVTDLCRQLSDEKKPLSPDQYFNFVFSHFALPFPAFENYDSSLHPTYPFVAILKFVIARGGYGVRIDDVFANVIGNGCTGYEPLDFYRKLKPVSRKPVGDELRQVREMMVLMGQTSYMKWFDRTLYIDTTDIQSVLDAVRPDFTRKRKSIAIEEFFEECFVGESGRKRFEVLLGDREILSDGFKEGGRRFITHGKIERSPLVRRKYFEKYPELICDACQMNPRERYPWTDNLLQLHHVFPLASTLNMDSTTTFLDDLVPLCPSCHMSIHSFYKIRLAEWGVQDFGSKKMARDVYNMAKKEMKL